MVEFSKGDGSSLGLLDSNSSRSSLDCSGGQRDAEDAGADGALERRSLSQSRRLCAQRRSEERGESVLRKDQKMLENPSNLRLHSIGPHMSCLEDIRSMFDRSAAGPSNQPFSLDAFSRIASSIGIPVDEIGPTKNRAVPAQHLNEKMLGTLPREVFTERDIRDLIATGDGERNMSFDTRRGVVDGKGLCSRSQATYDCFRQELDQRLRASANRMVCRTETDRSLIHPLEGENQPWGRPTPTMADEEVDARIVESVDEAVQITEDRDLDLEGVSSTSEENLVFLDASDSGIPDPAPEPSPNPGENADPKEKKVNISFVHSVYHTDQTHEEAMFFRMHTTASEPQAKTPEDSTSTRTMSEEDMHTPMTSPRQPGSLHSLVSDFVEKAQNSEPVEITELYQYTPMILEQLPSTCTLQAIEDDPKELTENTSCLRQFDDEASQAVSVPNMSSTSSEPGPEPETKPKIEPEAEPTIEPETKSEIEPEKVTTSGTCLKYADVLSSSFDDSDDISEDLACLPITRLGRVVCTQQITCNLQQNGDGLTDKCKDALTKELLLQIKCRNLKLGLVDKLKPFAKFCVSIKDGMIRNPNDSFATQMAHSEALNSTLLARLSCSHCKMHSIPPVSRCSSGHALCPDCRPEASAARSPTLCPVCSAEVPLKPCGIWTALAKSLRYPCRYAQDGCRGFEGLSHREKLDHEMACQHRQVRCYVRGCAWSGRWSRQKNHILAHHVKDLIDVDWYRFAPVQATIWRGFQDGHNRTSDVFLLGADRSQVYLVHVLSCVFSLRFLVQNLNTEDSRDCWYKLRFTTDENTTLETRDSSIGVNVDADLELRSGRSFRLDRKMFGDKRRQYKVQIMFEKRL